MPLLRTRAPRSGPAIAGDRAGRGNQPGGATGTDRRGAARNADPTGDRQELTRIRAGTDRRGGGLGRQPRSTKDRAGARKLAERETNRGPTGNRPARCWAGRGNQPGDRGEPTGASWAGRGTNQGGPTGTDQDQREPTGARRRPWAPASLDEGQSRAQGWWNDETNRGPAGTDRVRCWAGRGPQPGADGNRPAQGWAGRGNQPGWTGTDRAPSRNRRARRLWPRAPASPMRTEPGAGLGRTRKPTGADRNRPARSWAGRGTNRGPDRNRPGSERGSTGGRRRRRGRRGAELDRARKPTGGGQEPTGAELGGVWNRPGPDRNRPAQSWAGCGNQPGADRNRPESERSRRGHRRRRRAGRDADTDREPTGNRPEPTGIRGPAGRGFDCREESKVAIRRFAAS
jgi:hypothetical protein